MKSKDKILAVMRAGAFSPNHVGNDAAILRAVAASLEGRGYEVEVASEESLMAGEVSGDVVVNMCRDSRSVAVLKKMEDDGCLVINSGYGIANCMRESMTRMLLEAGVPHPDSIIVDTDADGIAAMLEDGGYGRCWIKRGDYQTIHKEDVSFVRHPAEAEEVIREYALRGIGRAVINKHLPGDLIKFYGVEDTDFFHYFYPFDEGHSKYGYELINGHSRGLGFSLEHLREICSLAARTLGVKVYGGDCIVAEDGDVKIIDFNDWPSFAPCRSEGAEAIAECIIRQIEKK